MHPCFETILIKDYKPLHVRYHNERYWRTCKDYKIVYDGRNFDLQYAPLLKNRKFGEFRIVEIEQDYSYKYLQRDWLDSLRKGSNEAILVKDGYLKDATIANIALKIDNKWFTPKEPLLRGTTRQRLLDEGKLNLAPLYIDDLIKAQNFAIMNALIGFLELGSLKNITERNRVVNEQNHLEFG